MTNKEILQADLLDILFENRNKAYGAYALRKNYNQRLQWSLGISLSLVLLLSMIDVTKDRSGKIVEKELHPIILSSVELPKPKIPETSQPPAHSQPARIKSTQVEIVPDDLVRKPEVPTINDLDAAVVSTTTQAVIIPGDPNERVNDATESSSLISKGTDREAGGILLKNSEAEYPGGKEAFTRFLTKYLRTPGDLADGEKKVVLVRFMVDADGTISKTVILQSDGEEYSKEVIRVLSKMPKWIPAMQNGSKVPTWFTQPVSFIGVE